MVFFNEWYVYRRSSNVSKCIIFATLGLMKNKLWAGGRHDIPHPSPPPVAAVAPSTAEHTAT